MFYKTIQEELESDSLEYFTKTIDLSYIKNGEDWLREETNEDEFLDIFMSKLRQDKSSEMNTIKKNKLNFIRKYLF